MESDAYIVLKGGAVKLSLNRYTNLVADRALHLNMDLYEGFEKCYRHYENKNWEIEPPLQRMRDDMMRFKKDWESIEK